MAVIESKEDIRSSDEDCPLCATPGPVFFARDPATRCRRGRRVARKNVREYRRCWSCDLVFVPSEYLLEPETEKRIYDEHENSPEHPGYRRFLSRLFDPMLERLQPGADGLDFGCGPGPVLAQMFTEHGFRMAVYDPFYAPDVSALQRRYSFVTCTEVLEHIYSPQQSLQQLWDLVEPGGILGVMTSLRPEKEAFHTWRYKNDPTHVRFYSRQTMEWLADYLNAGLEFVARDTMILTRKD
jgi:hypothetical protein